MSSGTQGNQTADISTILNTGSCYTTASNSTTNLREVLTYQNRAVTRTQQTC